MTTYVYLIANKIYQTANKIPNGHKKPNGYTKSVFSKASQNLDFWYAIMAFGNPAYLAAVYY
jgi:hypothetical protein